MTHFGNEMFTALQLSHSGDILQKEDLQNITSQVNDLINPDKEKPSPKPLDVFQPLELMDGEVLIKYR